MATVIIKPQNASQDHASQRRKNEANLRVVIQYYTQFGRLEDDRALEQVAQGLVCLEFMKKNCPEGTKLEDFCIQAGQYFEFEHHKYGDIIFNYGDVGEKVYIILKGEVAVLVPRSDSEIEADLEELANAKHQNDHDQKNKKTIKQMHIESLLEKANTNLYFKGGVCLFKKIFQFYSGQSFGDVALISDKPRTASILVVSDGIHLISMGKKDFKILCEKSVLEMNQTLDFFLKLFPNIGRMQITKFIQFFHKIDFAPQQPLWKQGDPVRYFLLILKGRVEIKQKQLLLYQVQDYSFVGHEEVLDGTLFRKYTCRTLDITQAFLMDVDDFNSARKNAPDIVRILSEKATLMNQFLEARKVEMKKPHIQIEPLNLPVERRMVKDMFTIKSPRKHDLRSSQLKQLSYLDITKFNQSKCKQPSPISEEVFFMKEKPQKTHRSPVSFNSDSSLINSQIKSTLIKKYRLQMKYNVLESLKITSCTSIYESSSKIRFKTEPNSEQ